jgi:hypothetical protein
LSGAALALFARYQYRGEHDTNNGLALRPPPLTQSAVPDPPPVDPPPAAASASTTTTATIAAAAPPAPPTSAAALPAAAPTEVAPAATTARSARPKPTGEPTAASPPTPPPSPSASPATSAGAPVSSGGISSETIAQAAQRALEGKDRDEKQGTRAAQLAFLATQQDPGNAEAWLTLGAAYEAMGKKQQAIESYRSCARKASAHPRVSECKQLAGIKD